MACQINCGAAPFCGNANIQFDELCVRQVQSCCVQSAKMVADNLCASKGSIVTLDSNNGCINQLSANDACVNSLKANDFQQCGKYRATAVYSAPTNYVLGSDLAFDVALDDPNNNLNLSSSGSSYTVPLSGYYIATLQVDLSNFNFSGVPVLGTPVANPDIKVNGNAYRQEYAPFLSFVNSQSSLVTTLLMLKAGDLVSASYNVISLDSSGMQILTGSATASGDGTASNKSLFEIHYLSSDCNSSPMCTPCQANTQCMPCVI